MYSERLIRIDGTPLSTLGWSFALQGRNAVFFASILSEIPFQSVTLRRTSHSGVVCQVDILRNEALAKDKALKKEKVAHKWVA